MIKGLRLGETWEYSLKADKPGKDEKDHKPTIFILGTLDSEEYGMIMDDTTLYRVDPGKPMSEARFKINSAAKNFQIVQYGLKGWKNLCDADGKEVAFETEEAAGKIIVPMALLRILPLNVITELAGEIIKGNTPQEAEVKN